MHKANKTAKDQGRNIFFNTYVNMKVPMQKGNKLKSFFLINIENNTIQHEYLQQLMENDKRKAERMNDYIRNLKVRVHGRELVTQSNFYNRKTPDLEGCLTLSKFGFSSTKPENAGSPGIQRRLNQSNLNQQSLPKRLPENKINHGYQSGNNFHNNFQSMHSFQSQTKYNFQNGNYQLARNNG